MAANILTNPLFRAFDASGNPLAGGKLYTYKAGTSTPKATYTDSTLTTPHTNPVILDAEGSAVIWLDGSYKLDLYSSTDVQQNDYPIDNVSSFIQDFNLYTTTGTANSYSVTTNNPLTSYQSGFVVDVKFNIANTGASSINVDGLGIKSITKSGNVSLVSGDIDTTKIYRLQYDGTRFQITTSLNLTQEYLTITSSNPYIRTYDSDGGTNAKYTELNLTSTGYKVRFLDDALSLANEPISLERTGYTCSNQTYTISSGAFNFTNDTATSIGSVWTSQRNTTGTSHLFTFNAKDSAANSHSYAFIGTEITDATNGSEDSLLFISGSKAGTGTRALEAGFNSSGQNVLKIHGTDIYTSGEKVIAQLRCNASTGTPTIVSSFGVSSITDNGVGDFTINLSTTVASATHIYAQICVGLSGGIMPAGFISTITTSSVRVTTRKWTSGTTEAAADLSEDFFVTIYARVY